MNAETLRAEVTRLEGEARQMLEEHQKMKDALVNFTAIVNSKLGEMRGYQRLLAGMENETPAAVEENPDSD